MCGKSLLREGELIFFRDMKAFLIVFRPLGGRHAAVIPALPEEYDASMPLGAYYPKREVSANLDVSKGLSHYPHHIIAQAEAQKNQQLASASAGTPLSSSLHHRSTSSQSTTQGQIALPPASLSQGLNIQHYQPTQQAQGSTQAEKRITRSKTHVSANTCASSASSCSTRTARGSKRQARQQQVSASASNISMTSASEAIPTTFAAIMSQFPVPGLVDTSHPGGGK